MPLPDPEAQARRFARVRLAHRTEVREDYVELIAELIAAQGEARAADLAERLGVTPATVANTLARLKRAGLVEMRPYRSIFLTEAGAALAAESRARHELV
ncbi:MAG TPA: MarR family transcriptional regulator, partial [Allosphingosinicella sp.]